MNRSDTKDSYPKTPYEALHIRRSLIKREMSDSAPSKSLEFKGIMVTLFGDKKELEVVVHYGFVYSRKCKQYFLFVDKEPFDYGNRHFALMNIFLIKENKLEYLGPNNTILNAPVHYPPKHPDAPSNSMIPEKSEWYCFNYSLHTVGLMEEENTVDRLIEILDSSWKYYVVDHGIETSD